MRPISPRRLASNCVFLCLLVTQTACLADVPGLLTADSPRATPPGAAGKKTLAGIDANRNGVRDDVEPFLIQHFGKNPRALRAASNVVIGMQSTITANTQQESLRAQSMMIRSLECLGALGEEALGEPERMGEVFSMLVDTPQRKLASGKHSLRIGIPDYEKTVRADQTWGAHCEVRADLVSDDPHVAPRGK